MSELKCSSHLDKEAKKEWKRIIKLMPEFDEKDIRALEKYCENYSDSIRFSKLLKESGELIYSESGYPQQHPFYQMKRNAEQEMRKWQELFPLSPASRARINKNQTIVKEDKNDPEMEEMISK